MSPLSNHMNPAFPHVQIGVTSVKYPENYKSVATGEGNQQKLKNLQIKNDFQGEFRQLSTDHLSHDNLRGVNTRHLQNHPSHGGSKDNFDMTLSRPNDSLKEIMNSADSPARVVNDSKIKMETKKAH